MKVSYIMLCKILFLCMQNLTIELLHFCTFGCIHLDFLIVHTDHRAPRVWLSHRVTTGYNCHNYGDTSYVVCDIADDDKDDIADADADADAEDETDIPAQGLPPFAITGSTATTENSCCLSSPTHWLWHGPWSMIITLSRTIYICDHMYHIYMWPYVRSVFCFCGAF